MRKPVSFKINAKIAATTLLLAVLGCMHNSASHAQETKGGPVIVTSVSSHPSANGTVVSIAADGPLNRAQTWQDREGYHVVVPSAGAQNAIKVGSGIKVRQLDRSLEIVIQTKPGTTVTVQPMGNRLNLNVEGKLDPRATEVDNSSDKSRQAAEELANGQPDADGKAARAGKSTSGGDVAANGSALSAANQPAQSISPNSTLPSDSTQDGQSPPDMATGESSVMSGATVLIVVGLVCIGLLVVRRRRASQLTVVATEANGFEHYSNGNDFSDRTEEAHQPGKTKDLVKSNGQGSNGSSPQRKSPGRLPVALPASLYGAYQVDLEIAKLVQGYSHRMDVVGSRAPDDRRAIEASLLKALNSTTGDEDMQRRARGALEEYGFVARQSAALLVSADPYERTSAARMLGDVKSPDALPFLLEALYDHESLVRNQAVLSIGELRLPSAIGALLDIARKHPDVPGSLLSRALSACSLEGLDFFDGAMPEPRMLSGVDARLLAEEILQLEPAAVVESLPESIEDEKLTKALEQIRSNEVSERAEAIKVMAQFSVRSVVTALTKVARLDSESSLRAAAISSLAFVNHESVFPAILIAMADESREVRAAAARSLSRLSFDRADAYIRVTETDDLDSLRDVAEACVKAGIAAQGIDRLSSGDHQAYESMSVVSLLLKANTFAPLLDAIANHPNMDVRLTAIHLLGSSGKPVVIEKLQNLLVDCPHEAMEDALHQAIARLQMPRNKNQGQLEHEGQSEREALAEVEPRTVFEIEGRPDFEPAQLAGAFETQPDRKFAVQAEDEVEEESVFQFFAVPENYPEAQSEPKPEQQVDSSGLPAPRIA